MATIGRKNAFRANRVSSLKPGLRGAHQVRNMVAAKMRGASYTKGAAIRFWTSLVFIIGGTVFLALWLGGFLPDVRQATQDFKRERLMSVGFVVERIDVMGEGRLQEDEVLSALSIDQGDYLFNADLKAAKKRIESLSWVEDALVRRLWPNRIVVQIIERRPYALWQMNGDVKLVDASGTVISSADPMQYTKLPLVVGEGAAEAVTEIHALVEKYPDISSRVNALVYINEARWDILMNNRQQTLKLPPENVERALSRLSALHAETQILDRDLTVIDLRLPDRISLQAMKAVRA